VTLISVKVCIPVHGTPQTSRASHAVWDLTLDTQFTYPRGMEGRVDLGGWWHTKTVYLSTDSYPMKPIQVVTVPANVLTTTPGRHHTAVCILLDNWNSWHHSTSSIIYCQCPYTASSRMCMTNVWSKQVTVMSGILTKCCHWLWRMWTGIITARLKRLMCSA